MRTRLVVFALTVFPLLFGQTGHPQSLTTAEDLGLSFVLSSMVNSSGGVRTEYRDRPSNGEEDVGGHEVLLQNTALLALYAVARGDKSLFDRQIDVIKRYFLSAPTGLLYWKLSREMAPFLSARWGTYSNVPLDSFLVARALLWGESRWGNPAYRQLASVISRGLLERNVAADGTLRQYAAWRADGSDGGNGDKVVFAYVDLLTIDLLAQLDARWQEILPRQLEIMLRAQTSLGLFRYWFEPSTLTYSNFDGNLLYMALTALHLAEYGALHADRATLQAADSFLQFVEQEYASRRKLFAKYDPHTGQPIVNYENIAAYGLITQLAFWTGRVNFGQRLLAEQILPRQQTAAGPLRGAFSYVSHNASAFDALHSLLALRPFRRPVKAVWYLSWQRDDYLSPAVPDELRRLKEELRLTHVALNVSLTQKTLESLDPQLDPRRTPGDDALRSTIRAARELGLGVILAPHLSVGTEHWVGELRPADVEGWFRNWQNLLQRYARIAEETRAELFVVGWELETMRQFHTQWQRLIGAVRLAYGGQLTYNTNWWASPDLYKPVINWELWRSLDYIGVTAFFDLVRKDNPSVADLQKAWQSDKAGQNIVRDMATLTARYSRCLLFGELGYESKTGTTRQPWNFLIEAPINEDEQLNAFVAAFQVFSAQPWFLGYVITAERVGLPRQTSGYTVLGKKAATAIAPQRLVPRACPAI